MKGRLNLLLTQDWPENYHPTVDYQFLRKKKPEWFTDKFVQRVIKGIDGADVLFEEALKDRFGHGISPEKLSSTAKVAIMMKYFPEWIYAVCSFGRNAWPYICELLQGGYTLTMIVNYFVLSEDVLNKGFDVYLDDKLILDEDSLEDAIADYFDMLSEQRKELAYSYSE